MRYKPLGVPGEPVSAIGFGMGLGGHFNPDPSHNVYVELLGTAMDRGITFIDSAEIYGGGQSETLIAQAVDGRRDEVFIGTKASPEHFGHQELIRAAEGSLRRLGIEQIDLYQLHWSNPNVPLEETAKGLTELVSSGKVRHVGVCNFSLRQLKEMRGCMKDTPVSAVQVEYNLFDRSIEDDFLPYCQRYGIAVIAYSPLDQGHICGGGAKLGELRRIGANYGKSAAQIALRWLILQDDVFVIPKAGRVEHVEENASAADVELTSEDIASIDRLTAYAPVNIPTDRIRVVPDDEGRRDVYATIEEARENRLHLTPSPLELADDLRAGNFLKAVRVRPSSDPTRQHDYDLVEGRIRYWAWVLSFGPDKSIPALVRE